MTPIQWAVYLGANTPERLVFCRGGSIRSAAIVMHHAMRGGFLTKDASGVYHLPERPAPEVPTGAYRFGVPTMAPVYEVA